MNCPHFGQRPDADKDMGAVLPATLAANFSVTSSRRSVARVSFATPPPFFARLSIACAIWVMALFNSVISLVACIAWAKASVSIETCAAGAVRSASAIGAVSICTSTFTLGCVRLGVSKIGTGMEDAFPLPFGQICASPMKRPQFGQRPAETLPPK